MNSKEQIIQGIQLMQSGYTMIAEAYDNFDMMQCPFPIDYQKLDWLLELKEETTITINEELLSVHKPEDSD